MKKLLAFAVLVVTLVILAVSVNAAVGTVVYAYKTDRAPNLDEIDETWGEPTIYVDKDSPNTELHKYWTEEIDTSYYSHPGTGPDGRQSIEPEPCDFWLYLQYDRKNLYVGIKSPDVEPSGGPESHRGDGIHMWVQPLESMYDPYSDCGAGNHLTEYDLEFYDLESIYNYYWNMSQNMLSVDRLFAGLTVDVANINFIDGNMHAIIAIPLSNMGLKGSNDLNGYELGTVIMRCSSKSTFDEGYAGWLTWGKCLRDYTPTPTSVNTIILVDPAAEHPADQTEPEVTEPEVTEPEVTEPEVTEPEVTEPEVTEPEVTEPEVTEPEVTEPEVTEPEVTEPEITEPEVTEPEVTEPEVTEPEVTEPEVTEPEVTEPEVTEPEVTEPEVTEPEVTEPKVTEPEVTEPEVTEPEVTEPEATEPEVTDILNEPKEKNNTALNVGIIVAVIVIGLAVVALIKKKK